MAFLFRKPCDCVHTPQADFDSEFTICQGCLKEYYRDYCFFFWVKMFLWQENLSKEVKLNFIFKHRHLSTEFKLVDSNRQVRIYMKDDAIFIQILSEAKLGSRVRPVINIKPATSS
jgi:hypothetical protein